MLPANVLITTDSNVVFNYPTLFTFKITNDILLPKFTYCKILLPPTIVATSNVYCIYGGLSLGCTYDSGTNSITINYFSSNDIPANTLNTSNLQIGNIYNPPSTTLTTSFQIQLLNLNNQIIEYVNSGLTYQVTGAADFNTLSLVLNNTQNSAHSLLSVSFSVKLPLYISGSVMVISFPSQISLQAITCNIISSNLGSISCSKSTNSMQVTFTYNSLSTSI
jgi:hypothetical protein